MNESFSFEMCGLADSEGHCASGLLFWVLHLFKRELRQIKPKFLAEVSMYFLIGKSEGSKIRYIYFKCKS